GRLSGGTLHLRPLPLAVLLARTVRRLGAQLVRTETGLVAGVALLLAGPADPVGAGRVSRHLLLLSRSLLQSLLGRSPRLRGRRAAPQLLGRAQPAPRAAKCASLLSVSGPAVSDISRQRRLQGAVVHGSGHGNRPFRNRDRDPGAARQRDP